jgi:DNA-directed RNA polymerase subunit omega
MGGEDVGFEGGEPGGEGLEAKAELGGLLYLPLPAVMGRDRAINLDANGEISVDGLGGEAVGVGPGGNGRPSNEQGGHGGEVLGVEKGRQGGSFGWGNSPLTTRGADGVVAGFQHIQPPPMRDDYIKDALKTIPDPNILINVVSRRVKQLKRGNRPLVESLEKLSAEDTALREVIEGKISHELAN